MVEIHESQEQLKLSLVPRFREGRNDVDVFGKRFNSRGRRVVTKEFNLLETELALGRVYY